MDLGGVVHYGAQVEEIIVRDGRAVGVRLMDGTDHYVDEVISAADGRATLFGMLKGRYMTPALEEVYKTLPLYKPLVQVSYGLNRHIPLSELPRLRTIRPAVPADIGGEPVPFLMVNNYSFDPTMAPSGKTALTVLYQSPWESWEGLQDNRKAYVARKARILSDMTAWLEKSLPGISADIEATDVATPLTTVHFTGNYHASFEGWRPTLATMRMNIEKRIPGLSHFAMIGQWTRPAAGLPTVAEDGRIIIEELCAQDGRPFVTTKPAAEEKEGAA
jgi:phytoene dehydrogenase-like protein